MVPVLGDPGMGPMSSSPRKVASGGLPESLDSRSSSLETLRSLRLLLLLCCCGWVSRLDVEFLRRKMPLIDTCQVEEQRQQVIYLIHK